MSRPMSSRNRNNKNRYNGYGIANFLQKKREQIDNKPKNKYIDMYGIDSLPHLKEAKECGCDVFMTTNKSMIEDREKLEKVFGIKIRTPKEMLEERNREVV